MARKKKQAREPSRRKEPTGAREEPSGRKEPTRTRKEPSGVTNPLAQVDDGLLKDYQRNSKDLIYEMVMRGGGEPFGAPFEVGVSSLTDKIVRFFKQFGFFGFETLEKPRRRNRSNKFTRYGAAPYRGAYGKKKKKT